MPLLTVTGLGKSFGAEDLFSDISFSIPHRARIALVGPNGIGKTTLLRILLKMDEPSAGSMHFAKNIRIGYLPQEAVFDSDNHLWEECMLVFGDLVARQDELTELEKSISETGSDPEQLEKYGKLQQQFDHLGGYNFENQIKLTLTGLGFTKADFLRPLKHLSGGQRTRALLAKLLLSNPDLLLLDEPTNHLDIQAVEWLESFMRDWNGAVLLVSHDRYFIDQVASTIFEMSPDLEVFRGNYSAYLVQREDRYRRLALEYEAQREFVEKEEEYIRRNMAGQNTRQAQGRLKRLERLLAESQLSRPKKSRSLHFGLNTGDRSGNLVLRTYSLQVGYADEGKPLFYVPDLIFKRLECAAIIGPNGAGKTTFLKTILNQIPPFAGEVDLGAALSIGYFAQAHEGLVAEHNLVEEIDSVAPNMLLGEIRDYLAKFLFTGDDVFKPVRLLSGGERGRLALAKLALQNYNLLLLDEPTNHLDLPSQEILQAVLSEFKGTILLVSHDRYLIDALATQIWDVSPDEKILKTFSGTYSEYKSFTNASAAPTSQVKVEKVKISETGKSQSGLTSWKKQKLLAVVEKRIADSEKSLAAISQQLANPPADAGKVQQLGSDYVRIEQEHARLMDEWGDLIEE
jgi:ATP-binding cassette subfamily F protein 3